jgi:hypothetical protein
MVANVFIRWFLGASLVVCEPIYVHIHILENNKQIPEAVYNRYCNAQPSLLIWVQSASNVKSIVDIQYIHNCSSKISI